MLRIAGVGSHVGHERRAEHDVQVLIVADRLKIVGEALGKVVAIDDCIIFALFLVGADGVFHLLGGLREYVGFVQVGDGAVDDFAASRSINVEDQIGDFRAGRNRSQR